MDPISIDSCLVYVFLSGPMGGARIDVICTGHSSYRFGLGGSVKRLPYSFRVHKKMSIGGQGYKEIGRALVAHADIPAMMLELRDLGLHHDLRAAATSIVTRYEDMLDGAVRAKNSGEPYASGEAAANHVSAGLLLESL